MENLILVENIGNKRMHIKPPPKKKKILICWIEEFEYAFEFTSHIAEWNNANLPFTSNKVSEISAQRLRKVR